MGRRGAVRSWPVWALSSPLRGYVITVIGAGAAAITAAAVLTPWRAGDAVMCGILLVFGGITVEAFRRLGEPAGTVKDAHGLWELAIAVLLPPFYALTVPIVWLALSQWRVRSTIAHRRVFTAAAVGLSYGAASLAFHAVWHGPDRLPAPPAVMLAWGLLAAACAALRWILNNALVLTAIRLDDPAARIRDQLGGLEGTYNDIAELCVGVLVAFCAATAPVMLIFALPCGTLLQRSARHAQLVHASRTDAKTGLLSAVAWQREAAVQVARAAAARTELAVAMLDIDHFKQVNDVYGHLAGDGVLQAVARILTASLREQDFAGRFGGEEFTVLLPRADADEALRIAERLRERLATITADYAAAGPRITVSIGVAALTDGITDLTDLLAAADTALYRAKRSGRNTVRLAGRPPPSA